MQESPVKPTTQKSTGRPVLIILIIMIVLLSGAAGYLVWQYLQAVKKYEGIKIEKIALDTTVAKQNKELEDLKMDLKELEGAVPKATYDSLQAVIQDLQTQIANTPTRVVYSGGGGGNKKEIESLKGEIAALQLKYDAVVKERDGFKAQNDKMAADMNVLTDEKNTLANTNKGLQDKVDLAAQLKFYDTMLSGYKLDKKGKKTFEEKAKKVMGFEVSFKIQENAVAEEGERMAYIVISGPNKKVLAQSSANVFQVGGIDKVYSIQKSFYFNNKEALITAEYKIAEAAKEGEYTAEIYVDGKLCGTAVNYLKK
jgi:hypothetical protein